MKIRVTIFGHIVVEDDVHSFDVHPTTEQIRRHENPGLEFFEFFVASQPETNHSRSFRFSGAERLTDLPEAFPGGFPRRESFVLSKVYRVLCNVERI